MQPPSWDEFRYHAVVELERMAKSLESMAERLAEIERFQSESRGWSKAIATAAGVVGASAVELFRYFFTRK
jgi:hypothetical protein